VPRFCDTGGAVNRAPENPHDANAGRHAGAPRKPLPQSGPRKKIPKTKTDTADHAGAEPHDPELMNVDAERADQEPAAPAQRRDDARLARSDTLKPAAPDRRRHTEHHKEQRVHPAEAGDLPIATGGEQLLPERNVRASLALSHSQCARQRQPEHAEAIGHADAKMNAERRGRDKPTVEAGFCDRMFAVENST